MPVAKDKKRILITLSEENLATLEKQASDVGITKSAYVSLLIRDEEERNKRRLRDRRRLELEAK